VFDLQKQLKSIRAEHGMIIYLTTVQEVITVHAKARKQFKRGESSPPSRTALQEVSRSGRSQVTLEHQKRHEANGFAGMEIGVIVFTAAG
jgi:hypothetical protein